MSTHSITGPTTNAVWSNVEATQEASRVVLAWPALTKTFETARALVVGGRLDEASHLLRQLIQSAPAYEEPWLQLLALDPSPAEEIDLLQAFLGHHPDHRFAKAFKARLHDIRIVAMLGDDVDGSAHGAGSAASSMRLGDYLIMKGWVTLEQVDHALAEQRRLRAAGVEQRLGTLLLMHGHVGPAQLAAAFAETEGTGFGEFGNYVVRARILTPAQVGQALARQAALAAELDRSFLAQLASYRGKRHTSFLGLRSAPRRKPVPKLGEVMVSMGLLTAEQVDQILRERHVVFNASFG